jgi:hypothetical protein
MISRSPTWLPPRQLVTGASPRRHNTDPGPVLPSGLLLAGRQQISHPRTLRADQE